MIWVTNNCSYMVAATPKKKWKKVKSHSNIADLYRFCISTSHKSTTGWQFSTGKLITSHSHFWLFQTFSDKPKLVLLMVEDMSEKPRVCDDDTWNHPT